MEKCAHCGCLHEATCPRIKAFEYHPDGTVKRIEFHGPVPFNPQLLGPFITTVQPVAESLFGTFALGYGPARLTGDLPC